VSPEEIADQAVRAVRALPVRSTQPMRAIRRDISAKLRKAEAAEVLAVARALIARGLRWFGWELITHHKKALASLTLREVEELGEGLASWDLVDAYGTYIAGPAWRDGQITDADVVRWAKDDDLWVRRRALVAVTVLNKKATGRRGGDARRTFLITDHQLDDRADMVVKAMSWALRSLAAVNPEAVRAYLASHSDRLAARVKREVGNKLRTGLKNPR
jgi:3-methyladenine DNA glycosylase AlkD